MPAPLCYDTIADTAGYDQLLNALYLKVKARPVEIDLPPVRVIAVTGSQPPACPPYQEAIAALYGVGYGLKMGMKFEKLPRPKGWFDYRVGALETLWWPTHGELRIDDAKTLRWQAYLMVPGFVNAALLEEARSQAKAKNAEVPYERVSLDTLAEGKAVQLLHVGPYSAEEPTIARLLEDIRGRGFTVAGKHHEIYVSDPRRTSPEKLKTIIRLPVKVAGQR